MFAIDNCAFGAAEHRHHAAVMKLFREARTWQQALGANTWPEFEPAKILNDIDQGYVFVVTHEATVIGSVTIFETDPLIWPDDRAALYIHRLATARSLKGRGLCGMIIDHAARRARAQGKRFLRLDCWAGNERLKGYYQKMGFVRVRDMFMGEARELPAHYWNSTTTLFERPVDLPVWQALERRNIIGQVGPAT